MSSTNFSSNLSFYNNDNPATANKSVVIDRDNGTVTYTNTTTSRTLDIGASGFLANGSVDIDPLNLSAIVDNITPTKLVVENTIFLVDDNTNPNHTISIQAGIPGVGSIFGLNYESTTNDDFVIQSSSSGSLKYTQTGSGATTKQLIFDPTEVKLTDTSNPNNTNTLMNTQSVINEFSSGNNQTFTENTGSRAFQLLFTDPNNNITDTETWEVNNSIDLDYLDQTVGASVHKKATLNKTSLNLFSFDEATTRQNTISIDATPTVIGQPQIELVDNTLPSSLRIRPQQIIFNEALFPTGDSAQYGYGGLNIESATIGMDILGGYVKKHK